MKRIDYLETVDGQYKQRTRRWGKTNSLSVEQESKSKTSISDDEKHFF